MSILQMSITAGLLVIAIVIIRTLALNRLPKKMFLVLWGVVLIRLLVPLAIPINIDIGNNVIGVIVERALSDSSVFPVSENVGINPLQDNFGEPGMVEVLEITAEQATGTSLAIFRIPSAMIVWLAGMVAVFLFFAIIYSKNHKTLRFATLIKDNEFLNKWLAEHRLIRPIAIMQSDRVKSPFAVGILRPRIVLPKSMDMNDKQLLSYVLAHEYFHVKRFDALWKFFLLITVCVHWFNPFVWFMVILANRDLELSCDEAVVSHFGTGTKKAYAHMLIGMAEHRGKFAPLYSGFSKNPIEERIVSVMKIRKPTIISIAIALVAILTIGALAAFSPTPGYESDVDSEQPLMETNKPEESLDSDYGAPYVENLIMEENIPEESLNPDYDAPTVDNPIVENPVSLAEVQVRTDSRIELLFNESEWAENEVGVYLSELRAFLVELVLQGDIHEQLLDFTCELSPGSQLHVRINDAFDALGYGWTGNTREIDGEIQRELSQIRNASIVCYECNIWPDVVMACVVWNEIWWGS